MKKIVVNDTNVFIDLFDVGLLEAFFSLPWEIHTTEFVMLELTRERQHISVSQYVDNGLLHISVFEPVVMNDVLGHGIGTDGAYEEHVMNLSEALALNLKQLGYIDRDLTLLEWLRECDYSVVNYERNYDIIEYGKRC